jgi:hypothetical protein
MKRLFFCRREITARCRGGSKVRSQAVEKRVVHSLNALSITFGSVMRAKLLGLATEDPQENKLLRS